MTYSSLLAFFLLASAATAQVTISGTLKPVGGPTICQQGETHILDCTAVYLKSSTVNLAAWEDRIVTVQASYIGVTCDVYEVSAIAAANVSLSSSGVPTPGGNVTFTVCVNSTLPGNPFRVYASQGRDNVFLGAQLGTQLIADPVMLIASGTSTGCGSSTVTVPNDPTLIGRIFYLQAAGRHAYWELSNPICLTVQ